MSNEARVMNVRQAGEMIGTLESGLYTVEYTDRTHLHTDQWVEILTIDAETPRSGYHTPYDVVAGYTIIPSKATSKRNSTVSGLAEHNRFERIRDMVAMSLLRCGILRPDMGEDIRAEVQRLTENKAVILVPDTQSLCNGTLHWLLKVLWDVWVWLAPPALCLTQIHRSHAWLSRRSGDPDISQLTHALSSRNLVNAALGLLERCSERYQVVEVDPQLFRHTGFSDVDADGPTPHNVFEDRMMLEAVHHVLGKTRSRNEKRVIASDSLFARILWAEGVPVLHLQVPRMPERVLPCLYYEPLAKRFFGAPLIRLLWDLCHCFSTVRLTDSQQREVLRLDADWPHKSPTDFSTERLLIGWHMPKESVKRIRSVTDRPVRAVTESSVYVVADKEARVVAEQERSPLPKRKTDAISAKPRVVEHEQTLGTKEKTTPPVPQVKTLAYPRHETRGGLMKETRTLTAEDLRALRRKKAPAVGAKGARSVTRKGSTSVTKERDVRDDASRFSGTTIPDASLFKIFRLAGALLQGPGTQSELKFRLSTIPDPSMKARHAPTSHLSDRVLDLATAAVLRANLAVLTGDTLKATPRLHELDKAIRKGDLDAASQIWQGFLPYRTLLEMLRKEQFIHRNELQQSLHDTLQERPSLNGSKRAGTALVYLGQAWYEELVLHDGSNRPRHDQVLHEFTEIVEEEKVERTWFLREILPRLCKRLRVSPWAMARQMVRMIHRGVFREWEFLPSDVPYARIPYYVIGGSLAEPELVQVPDDRIFLRNKPLVRVTRRI